MYFAHLEKECRALARQIVKEQYSVMDEIWKRRVRHSSVADYYDAETVKEITRRMPNLLIKNGGGVPLDELADEYGFSDTCALVERFANYVNKSVALERHTSQLMEQALKDFESGEADVPF